MKYILLAILTVIFLGCSPSPNLPISKSNAKKNAIDAAVANSKELNKYKIDNIFYEEKAGCWVVTFVERGGLLAVGEQFTVFVDANSGLANLFGDMGRLHVRTQNNLEKKINEIKKERQLNHLSVSNSRANQ